MIVSVAALVIQSSVRREGVSLQLRDLLTELGYQSTTSANWPSARMVTQEGIQVLVSPHIQSVAGRGGIDKLVGFSLRSRLETVKQLTNREVLAWARTRSSLSTCKFQPMLGRVTTVTTERSFDGGDAKELIKPRLQEFLAETLAFSKAFSGKSLEPYNLSWNTEAFDDRIVLDLVTPESIALATHSWGWDYKKGHGGSSNGWTFPITIGTQDFWLHQAVNEPDRADEKFWMRRDIQMKSDAVAQKWIELKGAQQSWAKFSTFHDGLMNVNYVVDLHGGMRLGDIRKLMSAFAARVAKLEKEVKGFE